MHLLFGTTNPAKVTQLAAALDGMPVTLQVAERDLGVVEDAADAPGNAALKAVAYAAHHQIVTVALDSALYLHGVRDDEQPGTYVRRLPGFDGPASDEQLIEHYTALAARYGGRVHGHFVWALALAHPDGRCETVATQHPRTVRAHAVPQRIPGLPLASVTEDDQGRALAQLSERERDLYWQRCVGPVFREFLSVQLGL